MKYDKVLQDGRVIKAPDFTCRVLDGIPVVFHLTEWLLFIVAFQYVDVRFGSLVARVVWIILMSVFSCYVTVLASNLLWRYTEDPYRNRLWLMLSYIVVPGLSASIVYLLLELVVKDMVKAQIGG